MARYLFEREITNTYLGKKKLIKAATAYELKLKVDEIVAKWNAEEHASRQRESLESKAQRLTAEYARLRQNYENLLANAVGATKPLNWEHLMDNTPFPPFEFNETRPTFIEPNTVSTAPKPNRWELILRSKKKQRFEAEQRDKTENERRRSEANEKYSSQLSDYQEKLQNAITEYEKNKEDYLDRQRAANEEVHRFRLNYESGDAEAVTAYLQRILNGSDYPKPFDQASLDITVNAAMALAVVDFNLPTPDEIPNYLEFRYVQSKKTISEKTMTKKSHGELYDSLIYQVSLRVMYEVFASEYKGHIQSVVFNGWINGIDPATGHPFTSCIITCQASRDTFMALNLKNVSPRDCVRSLKGLVAGPLHNVAPVKPILQLNREDPRFVAAADILADIDSSVNLAEMPWEDFEQLVRELFSNIFSTDGTEVKVTQASRDGGVDAIAFDPDPIRGGKFVIQAKRYNIPVPVSAVRDLYGTMISEGAVKGILVTTSYYGRDSLEFVKDKPISLIDGSNLVYMLSQYGYETKIELRKK